MAKTARSSTKTPDCNLLSVESSRLKPSMRASGLAESLAATIIVVQRGMVAVGSGVRALVDHSTASGHKHVVSRLAEEEQIAGSNTSGAFVAR